VADRLVVEVTVAELVDGARVNEMTARAVRIGDYVTVAADVMRAVTAVPVPAAPAGPTQAKENGRG